jgi:DNA-directed RNA polymerase alpha subunit
MKNKEQILAVQSTIQTFDIDDCEFLANWLSHHIKLLKGENLHINNIKELGLSSRSNNVLRINGIHSIDQLIQLCTNWDDVKMLRGAGKVVLEELRKKIAEIEQPTIIQDKPTYKMQRL